MLARCPDRLPEGPRVAPEVLQRFGSRLPLDFLATSQICPTTGITWDYKNKLPYPMIFQALLQRLLPGSEGFIRCQGLGWRQVQSVISYTQYWKDEINRYNGVAGKEPIDREKALSLLVSGVPGTTRLDQIARELRILGVVTGDIFVLTGPIIKRVAEAYGIIDGDDGEKNQVLSMFGLVNH